MSNIEWTDRTWNPVIGCTPVSPGCLNCYAATMANRMQSMPQVPEYHPREGIRIAEVRNGRAVFTGDVRMLPDRLGQPLKWREPAMVFVNSMSDLFHEAVPFECVDKVFAVMALCPQHTFQVLTKRPERMAEYFETFVGSDGMANDSRHENWAEMAATLAPSNEEWEKNVAESLWPLPNVWLGTSVERQQEADERIPHLLKCPAAVRFLSVEPLLGPVDLARYLERDPLQIGVPNAFAQYPDWVIVGGESGPGARPCPVEAIRSIVGQCKAAGRPCFVKQLGARPFWEDHAYCKHCRAWAHADDWNLCNVSDTDHRTGDGVLEHRCGNACGGNGTRIYTGQPQRLHDRKGGDMSEWPEDLRVREMPAQK